MSRTFHINLQKGCFGCQFSQFSVRLLNGRLDISVGSWHNSGVFEDRSLDYYILRGNVITLSFVKHSLLGTTHTGIKEYITSSFVRSCSINCNVSHMTIPQALHLSLFACGRAWGNEARQRPCLEITDRQSY